MTKKKKIAIFIISLYGGGAERVVSILLNHLKDRFDIHLVLLQSTVDYKIPSDQKITVLPGASSNNNLVNLLKLPLLAYRYFKFLKKNDIDVSFSFLNRANFISGFLKGFGWKGKVIISERTFPSEMYSKDKPANRIGRFLIKKLYPNADLIVCNSRYVEADLRTVFKVNTNYSVIYNPIDTAVINQKRERAAVVSKEDNPFIFVSLGRLSPIKNHLMLIKAAALLPAGMNYQINIIGKGELKDSLNKYIVEAGLQNRVTILDYSNDPFEHLIRSDCFVFTTNFEGFPNVLLEALACGLPVISTDAKGGIRELIAESLPADTPPVKALTYTDNGILIPVNNPGLLADAMLAMYENTALRQKYQLINPVRAKAFDVVLIAGLFEEMLLKA